VGGLHEALCTNQQTCQQLNEYDELGNGGGEVITASNAQWQRTNETEIDSGVDMNVNHRLHPKQGPQRVMSHVTHVLRIRFRTNKS
jgi:hypothetical protein